MDIAGVTNIRINIAAKHIAADHASWFEFGTQGAVGCLRGSTIILAVVADVKIEGYRVEFGPGVKFGKNVQAVHKDDA